MHATLLIGVFSVEDEAGDRVEFAHADEVEGRLRALSCVSPRTGGWRLRRRFWRRIRARGIHRLDEACSPSLFAGISHSGVLCNRTQNLISSTGQKCQPAAADALFGSWLAKSQIFLEVQQYEDDLGHVESV